MIHLKMVISSSMTVKSRVIGISIPRTGPFLCRNDVNKRCSLKVWGMVIVDRCSGAIHCDIVLVYSAEETIKTLRRFSSIRGWPAKVYSDPGSS